ncbi:collagen alpha-1(I) chain-like [Lemur catta]|uniref:collagen alpha-1(I) chain-like n=1 Tax=Lemur catta TaxID=9447 RepID=UPI001E26E81A|nr:collagen alpha-1(I) chain-like [Lemur catta]
MQQRRESRPDGLRPSSHLSLRRLYTTWDLLTMSVRLPLANPSGSESGVLVGKTKRTLRPRLSCGGAAGGGGSVPALRAKGTSQRFAGRAGSSQRCCCLWGYGSLSKVHTVPHTVHDPRHLGPRAPAGEGKAGLRQRAVTRGPPSRVCSSCFPPRACVLRPSWAFTPHGTKERKAQRREALHGQGRGGADPQAGGKDAGLPRSTCRVGPGSSWAAPADSTASRASQSGSFSSRPGGLPGGGGAAALSGNPGSGRRARWSQVSRATAPPPERVLGTGSGQQILGGQRRSREARSPGVGPGQARGGKVGSRLSRGTLPGRVRGRDGSGRSRGLESPALGTGGLLPPGPSERQEQRGQDRTGRPSPPRGAGRRQEGGGLAGRPGGPWSHCCRPGSRLALRVPSARTEGPCVPDASSDIACTSSCPSHGSSGAAPGSVFT